MKVNFDPVLKDMDGKAFKVKDTPKGPERELTLKDAALLALCTALEEDRGMDGKTSFERLELARRINKGGEVDLEPAEAALIQNRLPKVYPILIAGAAYEMMKG